MSLMLAFVASLPLSLGPPVHLQSPFFKHAMPPQLTTGPQPPSSGTRWIKPPPIVIEASGKHPHDAIASTVRGSHKSPQGAVSVFRCLKVTNKTS